MKTIDTKLSRQFFSTAPHGTRDGMKKIINRSLPSGEISLFATIENKAKLSAFRVVASEMGIELGDWLIRPLPGTATAKLTK